MFERKPATKEPAAPGGPEPAVPARTPRTPEREGLALAIARRDKARSELATIASSISAYSTKRLDAYRARDAAEAGIEAAKIAQAEFAARVAVGGAAPVPMSSREARDALDDARDSLEIVKATETRLEAAREQWGKQLQICERQIVEARSAVVRTDPSVQALLDRFLALQAELGAAREMLDFVGRFTLPGEPIIQAFAISRAELPNDSPWRTFFASLLTDADAMPPSA